MVGEDALGAIPAALTMLPDVVNPDVSAFIGSRKSGLCRGEAKGGAAIWSGVAPEMLRT